MHTCILPSKHLTGLWAILHKSSCNVHGNLCTSGVLYLQPAPSSSDLNLDALRQLNAAVIGQAPASRPVTLDPPRGIWTDQLPSFIKPRSFLQVNPPLPNAPLDVVWTAMHKRHDETCEKLLDACRHKPVVFSLKMLAEAFGNTSTREQGVHSSKKMHIKWKQFWVEDVLAGLLLRAQAEHMYEPSTLSRLPETLTAPLTDEATGLCAGMLHLSPSEVTFGALYVHFLAHVQSYLQSFQDYKVNVCELGKYLAGVFNATPSREAVPTKPTQQAAMINFWTNDALAAYLLSSLVKLLGREPVYPETAEMHEQSPDTSASNVPGSPSNMLLTTSVAATAPVADVSPASKKGGVIVLEPDADAESAPPFDSHWLMGSAPAALSKLAAKLQMCQRKGAARAVAAMEAAAVEMRGNDDATWQFLRTFSALPDEVSPWDDTAPPAETDGLKAEQEHVKTVGGLRKHGFNGLVATAPCFPCLVYLSSPITESCAALSSGCCTYGQNAQHGRQAGTRSFQSVPSHWLAAYKLLWSCNNKVCVPLR